MIELKFTGICEGCGCADIDVNYIQLLGQKVWTARCTHAEACRIARFKFAQEVEERIAQRRKRNENM